jgi:nicotinic acid mononucleotide adenylyltransferase
MDFFQTQCQSYHINFDKTLKRTRSEEDSIVSQWMVYLLASTAKVDEEGCQQLYQALVAQHGENDFIKPIATSTSSSDPFLALMNPTPTCKSVCFFPKGTFEEKNDGPIALEEFPFQGIILPGSFNPVHKGHFELATAAQKFIQEQKNVVLPIAFEIAISNADKGAIDLISIKKRVDQFLIGEKKWPVIVSTATLFLQKARLFKGAIFVIGADTAVRILDKKYYNQDEHEIILALNQIDRNNCSFVVAGRFDEKHEKRFISAEEIMQKVPKVFQHLFLVLKENVFRNDLSSTQLRQQQTIH